MTLLDVLWKGIERSESPNWDSISNTWQNTFAREKFNVLAGAEAERTKLWWWTLLPFTFTRNTVLSLSQSGGRYHLAHLCSTPTILRYWRHSKATFAPHQPSWGTGRHTKPSCITFFYFYYWSVPLIFNHWAFMDSHSQFFTESLLHLQHKHGSWQDAHLLPQHLSLFLFSSFLSKAHFLPSPFHSRAPRNTNAQLQGSE